MKRTLGSATGCVCRLLVHRSLCGHRQTAGARVLRLLGNRGVQLSVGSSAVAVARYDAFISHAGENKPFARAVADRLEQMGLKVFVDKDALKPGMQADAVMVKAVSQARVGVAVLDEFYFGKDWPMRELRIIMGKQTCLPVLLGLSYERLEELVQQHQQTLLAEDSAMLDVLRRISMVTGSGADMFDMAQHAAFAVLQLLVARDCGRLQNTAADYAFLLRVVQATMAVTQQGSMKALSKADADCARGWLTDLAFWRDHLPLDDPTSRVDQGTIPPVGAYSPRTTLPLFGRTAELKAVLAGVEDRRCAVVVGAPGEGKSALLDAAAIMLQRQHGLWVADVSPTGAATVEQREYNVAVNLSPLAKFMACAILDKLDVGKQATGSWEELEKRLRLSDPVLLLLQDVEQVPSHSWQDFKQLIAKLHRLPSIRLLIASRVKVDYEGGPVVSLNSLQLPAALELLAYVTGGNWSEADMAAAEEIAKLLDCNALLLTVVGGFVNSTRFSLQEAAEQARMEGLDLERGARQGSLMEDWRVAVVPDWLANYLTADDKRALAKLCVFEGHFTEPAAVHVGIGNVPGVADKAAVQRLARRQLRDLLNAHLLLHMLGSSYGMHLMVRHYAQGEREKQQPEEQHRTQYLFITWMLLSLPVQLAEVQASQQAAAVPADATGDSVLLAASQLLASALRNLRAMSTLIAAPQHASILQDPAQVDQVRTLADVLRQCGQAAEAQALEQLLVERSEHRPAEVPVDWRQALEILRQEQKQLGRTRPETLNSLDECVSRLWAQGDQADAVACYREVVSVLSSTTSEQLMGGLGTYRSGALGSAAQPHGKAFSSDERKQGQARPKGSYRISEMDLVLGESAEGSYGISELVEYDPDDLSSLSDVAFEAVLILGTSKAVQMLAHVLRRRLVLQGPQHPDTLGSKYTLAVALLDMGEAAEAVQLLRQAMLGARDVLGLEHSDTLRYTSKLAATLLDMGEREEGVQLFKQALEGAKKASGPEDDTAMQYRHRYFSALAPAFTCGYG